MQIVNWEEHFEGAKSKGYKNKTTCQMPTKHGLGYRKLIRSKNGPALFGAWCALIQVLSRHPCPREGYLTDTGRSNGRPLVSLDLELLTDIPSTIFDDMLQVCSSEQVGWIKDTAPIQHGYQTDTIGPLNSDSDSDSSYVPEFDKLWESYERRGSKKIAFQKWKKLSEQDKIAVVESLPAYFAESPDKQYRKHLERYISHKEFESVLERAAHRPQPGPAILGDGEPQPQRKVTL